MLEFVKTFDLLGSITQFLQERRQSLGVSDSATLRPRLVNQERGGLIIYTWNDLSEDAKVVGPVTHVGVYDPLAQKHKVLWIYNQKVKIVSCTLNRERTLLGFTTLTRQDPGQDGKPKDVYQAFLAELQSLDPRVFSLNLQRHCFLKVQFLYPDATPPSRSGSARHSYMVVMLHKESIGLYQIHMARIGDRGIMMSGQPTTEQIVRKFVWGQWDAGSQRLYYIHNVRQSSGGPSDGVGHRLSVIQFHSGNKFDNMIDVPINFPFPYIRSSTRSYYADIPLHPGIPDAMLNATAVSQSNGSLCLCYQEHVSSTLRPTRTASPLQTLQEEEGDPGTVDVNYYVLMVHHAKTLHGCATGLPRPLLAAKRIVFQWFGDYLTVTMPGVFCHLLNVNLDYEPCHHILLHNQEIPTTTKPPVPSSTVTTSTSQTTSKPVISSEKSSASNSTDMSDPTQDLGAAAIEVYEPSKDRGNRGRGDDSPKTPETPSEDPQRILSQVSASSQNLSPPPGDLQGVGSPVPSPLAGLSLSPPGRLGSEVSCDVISVIDRECFKLGQVLMSCYGFSRESGVAGANLYDSRTGYIWRLASNSDSLVKSFKAAYWSTKLAILHYLILLRTRDISTMRQVFETLTADPTAPETANFLSEYLVASTFASMKKKADRETTQLLTFTTADTFRGQFEKNASGERLARVTYISLDSVNISTKVSQERRRRTSEDTWDLLRRSLRFKQMPPPSRFSHEHVLRALQKDIDTNGSPTKKWTWVNPQLEESFFDGMHTVKLTDVPAIRNSGSTSDSGGGRRSRTETVLGSTPLFLQANQTSKSEPKKKVPAVTEQLLVSHLMQHLKKESRIKAQNIAKEYITCQMQQCQQLCHLLWSIHTDEETTAYEQLLPKLDEVGTDREYQLFQIYERVFLVTQEHAFPRPSGFSSYFTALGFKCLTSSLFLQYVDRGILQLTPDFILQLLDDLDDDTDEENSETKFHIISRLSKPFAEDCFRRWHHPVTTHFTAKQQVAQVLQEGLARWRGKSEGESGDTDDRAQDRNRSRSYGSGDSRSNGSAESAFKPLSIFIQHLEDTAMEVQRQKPGSTSLMYDTGVIEEAALFQTRNYARCDLSNMNF
ncbi:protein pigeon-like [Littorina saxatilis]|uniref:Gamma-secretase-activating protein C-terminal domain-containing protein n=1 Tax=Littorina saxatilis TaxID=31220 RepID=A0AAN9BBI5_9CAEN